MQELKSVQRLARLYICPCGPRICPIRRFFSRMGGIYHRTGKNSFTGRLASPGILFRKQAGRHRCIFVRVSRVFAPYGILRTQAGILSRKRKRRLYGRLARSKMPLSRTPFITPSGRHCITHLLNCQMYFVK